MNVKLRNNYGMELKVIGRVEEARRQYMVSLKYRAYSESLFTCKFYVYTSTTSELKSLNIIL